MNCVLLYYCIGNFGEVQFGGGRRGDLVSASSPKRTFIGAANRSEIAKYLLSVYKTCFALAASKT